VIASLHPLATSNRAITANKQRHIRSRELWREFADPMFFSARLFTHAQLLYSYYLFNILSIPFVAKPAYKFATMCAGEEWYSYPAA
jgi:hypothetical protein